MKKSCEYFFTKKSPDVEMSSWHPIRGIMNSNMLISLSKIDFVFFLVCQDILFGESEI